MPAVWTPSVAPGCSSCGDGSYTQAFTSVTSVVVPHNLGRRPAVSVIDTLGDEVEAEVNHATINSLTVSFSVTLSGIVLCN